MDAKNNTSCIDKPSPLKKKKKVDTGQIENLNSLNLVLCFFKS